MAHANAYGQDSAGNWVALDVNAVGEIVGLMAGGGLPMGQPSILTPWSYSAASGGITNTSDVTLIAAAGAGRSNYLTSLQVCNTSATATEVVVKSGSTVLWRCKVGASMTRSVHIEFTRPLISANNTALTAACITTGTTTYVDAQGYTDETIEQIQSDLTAAVELFDAAGAAIYDQLGYVITLPGGIQDSPLYQAPASFTPLDLLPLAWYDVNPAYCYVERGGGTTLSSIDGVVGTLRDRSGNAYHLNAATDAARPILRNSGALYWLEFDGTDDAMRAAFTISTAWSRYSALKVNTYVASDRIFSGGANDKGDVEMGTTTGTIRHVLQPDYATPATGTAYTLSEAVNGTAGTFSANAGTPTSMGTVSSTDPGGITVGAYWNGAVHAVYGAISFYGCAMRVASFSAGELTSLEAYYKTKAGL